jgi:hypothetical protein
MDGMTHSEKASIEMDRANAVVLPEHNEAHARVWAADNTSHDPFTVGRLAGKLMGKIDDLNDATKAAKAVSKKL